MQQQSSKNAAAMVTIWLVHSILVWLLVPLGFIVWLLTFPWMLHFSVSLGTFLGWVDLNFIALLQRTIARPFAMPNVVWVPFTEMPHVTHRIDFAIDPL